MPGRLKMGGCSMTSTYASCRAACSPKASSAHGSTVKPASSATGCAHPDTNSAPATVATSTKRSAAPAYQSAPAKPGAAAATSARAASHRKLRTARAPPARMPSAAGEPASHANGSAIITAPAPVATVTRAFSSPGVIEVPLRLLDRPKEVHESGNDPQDEADQRQPGRRAEPLVREVSAGQADDRGHHQCHADGGELRQRCPGSRLPGRRHVKKNTSTAIGGAQLASSP